jgi:cytochrome P450
VIGAFVTAKDDAGQQLSDEQIIDNLLLLLFAGYDTSSTTLTRILSLLQRHPAVLQQLRQEQQHLVAAHGEEITNGVLRRMTYAEAVIRWVLMLLQNMW